LALLMSSEGTQDYSDAPGQRPKPGTRGRAYRSM
jgi:hypothetical protein